MEDKTIEAAKKKITGFVEVIKERCKSCELCVVTCNKDCLEMGEEMNSSGYFPVVFIGEERCTGCGQCADMCADLALLVYK